MNKFLVEINECDSNPCGNGATCNEQFDMYNCTCAAGYTGIHCESRKTNVQVNYTLVYLGVSDGMRRFQRILTSARAFRVEMEPHASIL